MSHMKNEKNVMLAEIKSRLHVPEVGYYYANPHGGRFTYYFEGKTHYLHILSLDEAGELLLRHGLINGYRDGAMWITLMKPVLYKNGGFGMEEYRKPIYWQDFQFTHSQVVEFVALHELEVAEQKAGLKAKVIGLFSHKQKQVAA